MKKIATAIFCLPEYDATKKRLRVQMEKDLKEPSVYNRHIYVAAGG
ncbi:MAG: hypothetical protein PF904_21590 [Kiritimatiellae bacterium]|jgi:hypothetical protein|nr:hypothetical protein [Kiritimatiellia bacterium]